MRIVDLARVAAEAEGLRLKLLAKRQMMRAVWGAVAAVLGLFVLVMLHLTIFEFLAPVLGPGFAALLIFGVDLVAAGACAMLALRSKPGVEEREAAAISRTARAQFVDSATTFAVLAPVAKVAGAKGLRGMLMTGVATQLFRRRRRRSY